MIKVLLFAQLKETVGKPEVEIDGEGKSVKEVRAFLKDRYELLSIDRAMVAVNEEYANDTTVLKEGDVIAFIPPVSGG